MVRFIPREERFFDCFEEPLFARNEPDHARVPQSVYRRRSAAAVSEHGAPGRRPNIHAHFVGRQREDGLDTLPARAAEANRSTLIADIPFPAPENLAARGVREAKKKRSETVQDRGRFSSQDTR